MIKMIVTDLDGTLLKENDGITSYTLEILQRCKMQGIKFVIATARTEEATQACIEILKPDMAIFNNGALVKNGKNIVFETQISKEDCFDFIHRCKSHYHLENTKVVTKYGNFSDTVNLEKKDDLYQYNDFCNFKEEAYKITIKAEEHVAFQLSEKYKNLLMYKFFNSNSFIFTCKNASKEIAVRKIAEEYGFETSNVIAFGNDLGDIGMLKICGMGVAVANAIQEVKDVAKSICETNENDGVAKWLEKNINI